MQRFVPGWQVGALRNDSLGADPLVVLLAHGTTFHLMPRFGWDAGERYVMDLLSLEHGIYAITPSV